MRLRLLAVGAALAYWNMGLYLGGSSYGSSCTRWSAGQVRTLRSQGW